MISLSRWTWAAGLVVGLVLAAAGVAQAQQQGGSVSVTSRPVISGNPYIGSTLSASGGAWQTPNPNEANRTQAWWEWWRCPRTDQFWGCDFRTRNTAYGISGSDSGEYVFLARYVRWLDTRNTGDPGDDRWVQDMEVSAPVGPVRAAPPAPTPVPTP